MDQQFLDLLKENDEDKLREWVVSYGKPAKPISPIFFFYDLPDDEKLKVEEEFSIQIKEREDYL